MAGIFRGEEKSYAQSVCDFWQMRRIPQSPLYPKTRFLRWLHTDSKENYHKRGNKEFSVESVGYHLNSLGYRGPEFDREPGEVGVMFIGDSNTLGLGTPWEALWTTRVVNELERRWHVPVHQLNLAWGGTGSDYVAMMVHQAVEVLKPAAVFVLWSFVGRMTWFADSRCQVHFIPEWRPEAYAKDHSAYLRLATEAHGFFNYVRNFHLVNDRLSRLGIPFYWGNLEAFSPAMVAPYVPLGGYVGRWQIVDFARDGRHGGIASHNTFANLMIAALERDDAGAATQSAEIPRSPIPSFASMRKLVRRSEGALRKGGLALVPQPIRELIDRVRAARRVRALKRRDPFIY